MLKRRSKHFALLLVLTMLATMFVGVGTASAKSSLVTDRVISIADDFNSATAGTPVGAVISIQEDSNYLNDFKAGDTFKVSLPSGAKWVDGQTTISFNGVAGVKDTDWFKRTSQIIEITIPAAGATANQDLITITPGVEIDGASGDVTLTVDPLDSAVSGGTVVFAVVASGKTTATVDSVKKIGKTGVGGTIEVREVAVNSIGTAAGNVLTLKLPSNFEWNGMAAADVSLAGGFSGGAVTAIAGNGTRTLDITFTSPVRNARGIMYITPRIRATSDAAKGEISISISGKNAAGSDIADKDLVVAEYVEYGTTAKVKEVKDLKAGKFEEKTAKITIEETMTGSLIANRDINIALPSWVKITDVNNFNALNGGAAFNATAAPAVSGKKSYVDITVAGTSTSKGKIEFELRLSIQGDKSGDIEAKISGAGASEQSLVIAKAIQRATLETSPTDVKVGIQEQVLSDVIIGEVGKEYIALSTKITGAAANNGLLTLKLTEGVKYSTTPKVEVIEGNLEIKDVAVDGGTLSMNVKSESSKASKIKVSGIKATLDRSVPEGPIYAKLGGSAVIENSKDALGWLKGAGNLPGARTNTVDEGEFDVGTVVKANIANVITPAPQETGKIAGKSEFVIGTASYKLNGVEQSMDVAPYIKDSRTYMPIRYVANAMGIADANILWDEAAQTVTLSRASTFVQVKIGSKTMLVNGIAITLDVAPEISSARTMLPVSHIARAFGANVEWDAATQTVTIN